MQNLDSRLVSFSAITKPKSKAKPAFPLSSSSHPNLTPNALANAGFYHSPGSSSSSADNCTCFLCGLELGGWDEGDDPFEEHAGRGGCAWAEMVCAVKLEKRKRDASDGSYVTTYPTPESLPQSAQSAKIREQTFKKWWPHKQKSGWLPTVKELARAGFVFNPSTSSKDAVICPYCEYAVEGWEATDDPWQIHSSKVPDCHFFRSSEFQAQVDEKQSQSKASGRSGKSQAKSSRSKRGTTAATAVSVVSDAEDEPVTAEAEDEEEPSASQAATSSKRAAKPRATATTTKAKGGKGRKKAATVEPEPGPIEEVAELIEAGDTDEEEPSAEEEKKTRGRANAAKSKPKATTTTKGKGKKKAAEADIADEDVAEEDEPVAASQAIESDHDKPPTPIAAPAPISKTKSTSSRSNGKPKAAPAAPTKALPPIPPASPSQSPEKPPRPLSQLDRFANIPPSSPIPSPRPKSTLRTTMNASATSATHSRANVSSKDLPRETLDTSLQRGAVEARKVMDDLMSSPLPLPLASPLPLNTRANNLDQREAEKEGDFKLTEEQKGMTLEELVRSEMRRRYEEMQKEGEEMIDKWKERAKYERKRIDAL